MKKHVIFGALLLCLAPAAPAWALGKQVTAQPSRAEFARLAGQWMKRRYPADGPGAVVLVARGDHILFRAARGTADMDRKAALETGSTFRIASITKQFAAAGLLQLVEAGKIGLDDPLSRYIPDYPDGHRITILQLLNHTSGVRSHSSLPPDPNVPAGRPLTTAGLISVFKNERPDFEPGQGYAYNNSGYALVGAVIEAVTGMPWHAWLDRSLFKPLGMRDTGYAGDPRLAARLVRGYRWEEDKPVPAPDVNMTRVHAAGALLSTADDLLKWNRALHEGRVLGADTYRRMITPVGKAVQAGYGFGLFTDRVRTANELHHGGGIEGFITLLSYLPGPDISVIVLENDERDEPENGRHDIEIFARRLAALALGEPYPELRPVEVGEAKLKEAEGVYAFDGGVTRILRIVDGRLTAQREGRGPRLPLVPIAADDFLYEDSFTRLKLERDPAGRIVAIRLFPSGDGGGEAGARTAEPLPADPVALQLPRAALERLAGTYSNGRLSLKLWLDGAALKAQLGDQPAFDLRAISPTEFDVGETGATLVFPAGDSSAAQVTMRQGKREMVLPRTP